MLAKDITSGQLVSFLLYLSSLSEAFNSLGSIFSAFTQALGAADKGRSPIHPHGHLLPLPFQVAPPELDLPPSAFRFSPPPHPPPPPLSL